MSSATYTIRDARESDIPQLSVLITQLGYPSTPDEVLQRYADISQHPDYRTIILADGETPIGMAGLMKGLWYEKNGIYVRILSFVIATNYRGRGAGKILIKAVEDWAVSIEANAVLISSGQREDRIDAHHFYQKAGYQIKSLGFIKQL